MGYVQLHGIVDADATPQGTAPEHRTLSCGPFVALVSDLNDAKDLEDASAEDVAAFALAHHDILAAYCTDHGVVPMRFGTIFSGDAAIRAELKPQTHTLARQLSALRDLREYTVRLNVTGAVPGPQMTENTGSGRDHLLARKSRRDQRNTSSAVRRAFARGVLHQLHAIAVQVDPADAPKPGRALDCVLLLRRDKIPMLAALAQDTFDPACELGLDLKVTGPWPPYSFDMTALPDLEIVDDP